MKLYTTDAQDALEAGDVIVGGAVEILSDPSMRIFSGYGELEIGGETYTGVGDRQLVSQSASSIGGTEQGITLELSGVDPDIVPLINYDSAKRAICTLYRLMLNSSGTVLLDAQIFARGRLDMLPVEETIGGTATIMAQIETAARGLGRRGGRRRTDPDQRFIKADDGSLKAVSFAGQKTLYWGGRLPATLGTFAGNLSAFFGGGIS